MSIQSETLELTFHHDLSSPYTSWIKGENRREKSLQDLDKEDQAIKDEFKRLYGDERTLYEEEYALSYFDNYPTYASGTLRPYKYVTALSEVNYSFLLKFKGKRFARNILISNSSSQQSREHLENKKVMEVISRFVEEPWTYLKEDYISYYHPKFLKFLCSLDAPKRTVTISRYVFLIFKHIYHERFNSEMPSKLKNELKSILDIKKLGLSIKLDLEEAGIITKKATQKSLKMKSKCVINEARSVLRKMNFQVPSTLSIKDLVIGVSEVQEIYQFEIKGTPQEGGTLAFFTILHFLKGLSLPSRPNLISLLLALPKNDTIVIQTYRKIVQYCEQNPQLHALNEESHFSKKPIEEIYTIWEKELSPIDQGFEHLNGREQQDVGQMVVQDDLLLEKAVEISNILHKEKLDSLPEEILQKLINVNDVSEFVTAVTKMENISVQRRFSSVYQGKNPIQNEPRYNEFQSLPNKIEISLSNSSSFVYYSQTPDIDVAFLSFVRHFVETQDALVYSKKFGAKFLRSFFPEILVKPIMENLISEIPTDEKRMVVCLDVCSDHNHHPKNSLCRKVNQYPELVVSFEMKDRIIKNDHGLYSEILEEMKFGRKVILEQRNPILEKMVVPLYGKVPWRVSSLLIDLDYYAVVLGTSGAKVLLEDSLQENRFLDNYLDGNISFQLNNLLNSSNLSPFQISLGGDEIYAIYLLQIVQLRILQSRYCKERKLPLPPVYWFATDREFSDQLKVCGLNNHALVRRKLGIKLLDPSPLSSLNEAITFFHAFFSPVPRGSIVVFPSIQRVLNGEYVPMKIREMDDEEYYSFLWDRASREVEEFDSKMESYIQEELQSYLDDTASERTYELLKREAEQKFQMKRRQLIQSIDAKIRAAVITRSSHNSLGIPHLPDGTFTEQTKVRLFQFFQLLAHKAKQEGFFILLGYDLTQQFKVELDNFIQNSGSYLPGFPPFSPKTSDLEPKEKFHLDIEMLLLETFQLETEVLSKLPFYSFFHFSNHNDSVIAYLKSSGSWRGEIWNVGEVYSYLRKLEG